MHPSAPLFNAADDMDIFEWLQQTWGQVFKDDVEELSKIRPMQKALLKVLKVSDAGSLRMATRSRLELALAKVVSADEVPGTILLFCKFLGVRGNPHELPGKLWPVPALPPQPCRPRP